MRSLFDHSTTILFAALGLVSIWYAFFEWNVATTPTGESHYQEKAEIAVDEAATSFRSFIFNFNSESVEFVNQVKTVIDQRMEIEPDEDLMNQANLFWGTAVFIDSTNTFWSGFTAFPEKDRIVAIQNGQQFGIETAQNVTFLYAVSSFLPHSATDSAKVTIVTSRKVIQDNILPVGNNLEFSPEAVFNDPDHFPVRFSFTTPPITSLAVETFQSQAGDTLGYVYSTTADITIYERNLTQSINTKRGIFLLVLVILFATFFAWITRFLPPFLRFAIQLSAYYLIWFAFRTTQSLFVDYLSSWLPFSLVHFMVFIGLLLLAILSFERLTACFTKPDKCPSGNLQHFFGAFSGLFLYGLWYLYLYQLSLVLADSQILLHQQIELLSLDTNLFVVSAGFFFFCLAFISATLMQRFLFFDARLLYSQLVAFLSGIALGYLASHFVTSIQPITTWSSLGTLALLLLTFSILIVRNLLLIKLFKVSLLRIFLFINAVFTLSLCVCVWVTFQYQQERLLTEKAREFQVEDEADIQAITASILTNLQTRLSLFDSPTSAFEQVIPALIQSEWLNYSISIQLIDTEGRLLDDYTTNLSAPQWSTYFNVNELLIPFEDEQINRLNLRPILRSRPINTINAQYSSFRRGWIPLYSSSQPNEIRYWILASVYKEIPELNKPLRTVITSNEPDAAMATISLTEYQNRVPIRSAVVGNPIPLPDYSMLPLKLSRQVDKDSVYISQKEIRNTSLVELFLRIDDNEIVRAATRQISISGILFLFLRVYFTLSLPFLIGILLFSGETRWNLFGDSRRIRDRLIDRFIISCLLCLFVLVTATYFVLDQQNTQEVEDELLARLNNLVSNIESDSNQNYNNPDYLEQVTSILSEDAALYKNAVLINSTTPQIYTQHLLPKTVPWEAYQSLMADGNEQVVSVVSLDDLKMMIGYQPWFNATNEMVGIAAIPTFLRAPKFYEQLFSTTSYLVAIFSFIFGLLMVSVSLISSRMTAPLQALQEGLQKISEGDLETNLPVTSNDEIGLLTTAYNTMGSRLKELQQELAQSEREAAWKEMAQQVAHEIKNPLTPMKLNLQHLERQMHQLGDELATPKHRITSITKSMIEQIDALTKIASDFSKFAKPIDQEFTLIDVNALIKSVSKLYVQDDEIDLELKLSATEQFILGAQDELRRVFVNLIKNGREAIQKEGSIFIETNIDSLAHEIEIIISDTGTGIHPEDEAHIFTPNFSTKTSGTGLGLAISKKIIEEHHGSIRFSSKPGSGTQFFIRFPLQNR